MNKCAPFQPADLDELGDFLDRAGAVVAMEDIADACSENRTDFDGAADTTSIRLPAKQGDHIEGPAQNLGERAGPSPSPVATSARVIGMRHDVDNFIAPAVQMADWEAERGYRSTYFILHTAPYWQEKDTLQSALEVIADCGHEIGFHLNAITEAIKTGEDPLDIAQEAVDELRSYGYQVRGVVAHGDEACYEHHFINDEIFVESRREGYGPADRVVGGVRLKPISRADLGFDYDPNWLPRGDYLSDSGGRWSQPFDEVTWRWPSAGQLHVLQHPCWWSEAFVTQRAAA